MRHQTYTIYSLLTASLGLVAACTINSTTTGDGADASNSTGGFGTSATGGSSGTGGGTGVAVHDAGPSQDAGSALGFSPSNIPSALPDATAAAVTITGTCQIDTDSGTVGCLDSSEYTSKRVTQNDVDGTAAMLVSFSSLSLTANANVSVKGSLPLIIVAGGAVNIAGTMQATPATYSVETSTGGGFSAPTAATTKGGGPGGGLASSAATHVGGGGGAYCGKGGNANGGTPFGNAEISPLIGGSSGASGFNNAGAGGGAIQLVSGVSITIATTGVVNVGGGGAWFGASGGGAGGAILLEAPTVTIRGTLAANGGAGSANSVGADQSSSATPYANPAPGGTTTSTSSTGVMENPGGNGSAAATIDGSAGQYVEGPGAGLGDYGGGGGGGAGRIRINTSSGQAAISGTVSPSATTSCVSQGKLETG